jgi:hypothetical protein
VGTLARVIRQMSVRMVRRICLVGAMDVAYRVFLRDFARRWVGVETQPTSL